MKQIVGSGSRIPYWNTFYQEIRDTDDYHTRYLGQMDLNIKSEKVWDFYRETIKKLAGYGAKIIRLDALYRGDGTYLEQWAKEQIKENIHTVNMLGCHDGIPVLDLAGLLPDDRIEDLIRLLVERGGFAKRYRVRP